jgi:hypothetical protein
VRECQSLEAIQGGNLKVAATLLQFLTGNVCEEVVMPCLCALFYPLLQAVLFISIRLQ